MSVHSSIMQKIRREDMRWHLLATVNVSRPQGIYTEALLPVIQAVYPDATQHEIRRELDYLEERHLAHIKKDPMDRWFVDLTRFGIDFVEYSIEAQPGISRPIITQG